MQHSQTPSVPPPVSDAAPSDFSVANQHLRDGRGMDAVVFYRQAIQRNPEFYGLHENLGDALSQLEFWAEAEAAYQQAIALNPRSAWPHGRIAQIKMQQQAYKLAIPSFRQAIALAPTCAPFYYGLSHALTQQGNTPEASKTLQRLGAILREQGDLSGAIAAYQQALALNPQVPALYQSLGECWQRQGNFADACRCYQRVVTLQGVNQHLWFYKNWGEAILLQSSQPSQTAVSVNSATLSTALSHCHQNVAEKQQPTVETD